MTGLARTESNIASPGVRIEYQGDVLIMVAATAILSFPEMRKGLPPAAIMAYLGRHALPKRIFPLVVLAPDIT